jgi:AMP deaminase
VTGLLFSCHLAVDRKPIFDIPNIREYFMDLDFVLGVISDGPAKSFAFRRLQYLRAKFTMYTLLNEFQEMTEMKVRSLPLPLV